MKRAIRPLIVGNWKMNPQTVKMAHRLANDLRETITRTDNVEVVIAPPVIYLETVARTHNGSRRFSLGAQNVHFDKLGAHTGETSLSMLASFGVTHVILGHSERRAEGETDEIINKKVRAAIKGDMTTVACVGETERDHSGQYLGVVESEVRSLVAGIGKARLGNLVIAYEPIWAIGTGIDATPDVVHEMRIFIQKVLTDIYDRASAGKVRILYGGSVTAKNVVPLLAEGAIDGFLVGGASLRADEFGEIVRLSNLHA